MVRGAHGLSLLDGRRQSYPSPRNKGTAQRAFYSLPQIAAPLTS